MTEGRAAAWTRLRLRRNPVSLALSGGLWAAAGYLGGYLVLGWLLFSIAFVVGSTTLALAITLAGLPLLIVTAAVARGCANLERGRLRTVITEPVTGRYRTVTRPGIMAQVGTRWGDPATWRDLAYLVGLFVPLMTLDFTVTVIWLAFLAGITLPFWYWAPTGNAGVGYSNGTGAHGVAIGYFPHGPNGAGAAGLYVDTLPKALLAAAAFLVLFLLFNYVLVGAARLHAAIARALLRAPTDPLAAAKKVLAGPGPLPPLLPNGDI